MATPTEPWSVRTTDQLNRDGRSCYLVACPADGGHVTEADAEWLRTLIRQAQEAAGHEIRLMPIQVMDHAGHDWMVAFCSCGKWASTKTTSPQEALKSGAEHRRAKIRG